MNAEYPANPAAPGAHPFPGVTQAVPQGSGGPEAAPAAWGAVAPQSHSPQAPGGGSQRPAPPAAPPANPYANPGGHTASQQTTGRPHAPQPSAPQPTTAQPNGAQPSSPQPTSHPAPVRRASLRTGTQEVTKKDAEDESPKRKIPFFGKKDDADDNPQSTTTLRSKGGPRKVRAMLSAVDPWSITKMSFLVAVASGIALVVAVSVLWGILDQMGVWVQIQQQITTLFGADDKSSILQYVEYNKAISAVTLVASFNVLLITALGAIGALIYNVIAKLVGGVYITLSDD